MYKNKNGFLSIFVVTALLFTMFGFPAHAQYEGVSSDQSSSNLLQNGGFESVSGKDLASWSSWQNGYKLASDEAHTGKYSVTCMNPAGKGECGVYQIVVLDREDIRPLKVSGWSRAQKVSGSPGEDYSLRVDITYTDGTGLQGQAAGFQTGTHDWEYIEFSIQPEKPVKTVAVYAQLRNKSGKVWFDDISVEESPSIKAMKRMDAAGIGTERFVNGNLENADSGLITGWDPFGKGYTVTNSGGRNGSQGVMVENTSREDTSGIAQTVTLNGADAGLLVISAWSKAEGVDGDTDQGYALWMDISFMDGTNLWGQTASFSTGTHDWQQRSYYFYPQKPVQSISVYGLFRNGHTGKVWFDDFSVRQITTEAAAFEDAIVQPLAAPVQTAYTALRTSDGLAMSLGEHGIVSLQLDGTELAVPGVPSGFLVADQAQQSDVYSFTRMPNGNPNNYNGVVEDLGLEIDADFTVVSEGIKVSGRLTDKRQTDRAVTLTFALPVDASGWEWGDYIRSSREIDVGQAGDVYTNSHLVDFETGPMSKYPISAIYNRAADKALSIGVDYNKPTHYRLDYNGGTKQLLITFEFGLAPDTSKFPSSAEFAFVIYRFGADWGFRSAFDKYTRLFPEFYSVRVPEQGIWMPFASIRNIPDWQDFGFKFKEGDEDTADTAFANENDILVFHYAEPSTWWQSIDPSLPKTVETAINARDSAASQGNEMAKMAQAATMINSAGNPYLQWSITPWNTGALWMINANPDLPGEINGYTMYYSEEKLASRYLSTPKVNGEYLDTLDGFAHTLNYDRDHFPYAIAPLVFSKLTGKPAVHRAFSSWELVQRIADRMHSTNNYTMANGTPLNYSMYMPWLDVAGIETNWLGWDGSFAPDSDERLSSYRTLSGKKPYLLLQNTDSTQFGYNHMEKYMQRSLFYGIFPSNFVASNTDYGFQYWTQPQLYERDRPLFKKYIPIIKQAAEAGWMPVTHAASSDSHVYIERYGEGEAVYLTLMNESASPVNATITIDPAAMGLNSQFTATELIAESSVSIVNNQFTLNFAPGEVKAVKFVSTP